jgi:hypothetical protein
METTLPRIPNIVTLTITDSDGTLKHSEKTTNSRVDTGALKMLSCMFDTATQPAAFNYVALSTQLPSVLAVKSDTAVSFTAAGEITTNGLGRKQATYTYTNAPGSLNGNATATLTTTWTATGGGTIGTIACLNGLTNGASTYLGLETNLASVVSYNATDTIALSWVLNQ